MATTGVAALPIPGTKSAPKKFTGKYAEVRRFIQHYERLCDKLSITDHREKISNITQYCARKVRQFIEGLPSYNATVPNWDTFKSDVLKFFDADKDDKRYKVKNLEAYVKESRKKSTIKSLGVWREYIRHFLTISGWLKKNGHISADEEALYFWKGIPRSFRQILEPRLLAAQPNYDLSKPFDMTEIYSKAEALLQRNRFDADRLPSDDEEDSDDESDSEDSDGDGNSSDSESDSDVGSRKKKQDKDKKKKKTKKRKASRGLSEDTDNEDIKKAWNARKKAAKEQKKKADDLEDLVHQLNHMSLEDPEYGVTYLRACLMNPLVASVARKPIVDTAPPMPRNMPPSIPRTTAPPMARGEMKCYGCGKPGHGLNNCQEILNLIAQGTITRDTSGRLVMKNGERIFRGVDEPFTTAIQRQIPPHTHLITVKPTTYCAKVTEVLTESESEPSSDYDSDDEDESDEEVYVMPVERSEKTTRVAHRDFVKGPVVPPVPIQEKTGRGKGKGNVQKDQPPHLDQNPLPTSQADRRSARIQGQPGPPIPDPVPDREVRPPSERKPENETTHKGWNPAQPIDVGKRTFDPLDDDAIMDDEFGDTDAPKPKKKSLPTAKETKGKPREVRFEPVKRVPKQSEVQSQVDQLQILGKVLNTPVTLVVGEVFGISKEMSHHLQDVLKPKPPAVNLVASSFITKTRALLINLPVEIDGNPITAIIDTGSQLNIANKRTWKTMINRPMDIARSINMNDANGGAGLLRGLVENVPLTCGGVLTYANLYIGDRVPFDLLLGRPWQRGNYISINE